MSPSPAFHITTTTTAFHLIQKILDRLDMIEDYNRYQLVEVSHASNSTERYFSLAIGLFMCLSVFFFSKRRASCHRWFSWRSSSLTRTRMIYKNNYIGGNNNQQQHCLQWNHAAINGLVMQGILLLRYFLERMTGPESCLCLYFLTKSTIMLFCHIFFGSAGSWCVCVWVSVAASIAMGWKWSTFWTRSITEWSHQGKSHLLPVLMAGHKFLESFSQSHNTQACHSKQR